MIFILLKHICTVYTFFKLEPILFFFLFKIDSMYCIVCAIKTYIYFYFRYDI